MHLRLLDGAGFSEQFEVPDPGLLQKRECTLRQLGRSQSELPLMSRIDAKLQETTR